MISTGLLFDFLDAGRVLSFEVEGVVAAYNQGGLIGSGQGPFAGLRGNELEMRPRPIVKAPLAANYAGQFALWQRGERLSRDKSTLGCVGHYRQVKCDRLRLACGWLRGARGAPRGLNVQDEVVSQLCGEDQWRTCDLSRRCPFDQNRRSCL